MNIKDQINPLRKCLFSSYIWMGILCVPKDNTHTHTLTHNVWRNDSQLTISTWYLYVTEHEEWYNMRKIMRKISKSSQYSEEAERERERGGSSVECVNMLYKLKIKSEFHNAAFFFGLNLSYDNSKLILNHFLMLHFSSFFYFVCFLLSIY